MIPAPSAQALIAAAPQALQLFTSEPVAPPTTIQSADQPTMILWITAGVLVLAVSAVVSILAWRGRWRDPPAARALNALAGALALRGEAKAMLHRLAKALGAEPVALLMSESAFERAVAALEGQIGAFDQRDKAAVLALHAKAFGISHHAGMPMIGASQSERESPPLNIAA